MQQPQSTLGPLPDEALIEEIYPTQPDARDRWILARRPPALQARRDALDVWHPQQVLVESEPDENGVPATVATLFLTNRECPWRCLMCDLWQYTTRESVPEGAITAQIKAGLQSIEHDERWREAQQNKPRHLKLYNSGSFFDHRAINPAEDAPIAQIAGAFERVIVESHPRLVGARCREFAVRLRDNDTNLEVAMGLETVHPLVLEKLNKRAGVEDFRRAADFLRDHSIALRLFVLVRPPFLDEAQGLESARRALDFAVECGASVVTLIPTRGGNGALETLAQTGDFAPPRLSSLEAALDYGIELRHSKSTLRVFADDWDLDALATCPHCFSERRTRLQTINRTQRPLSPLRCAACDNAKVL